MRHETNHKILLVDDERNLLESFEREFHGKYDLITAMSGAEALSLIEEQGPFAVIVSDYKMPAMGGVELLAQVRKINPDTVRIMLTGYADLDGAIQAVNSGRIFQFLTKPCPAHILEGALELGLRQYELVMAERELLEQTLRGSVNVLTELLSLVSPVALGRATRIMQHLRKMIKAQFHEDAWELETAAMLSQVGCVALDEAIVDKASSGRALSGDEQKEYLKHPALGAAMLNNIPRMQGVSRIIAYQEKNYDGSGVPRDQVARGDIPLGSRLLRVLMDFDALLHSGHSKGKALEILRSGSGTRYDPEVVEVLASVLGAEGRYDVREVMVGELDETMTCAQAVFDQRGHRQLLLEGQPLSPVLIMNLKTIDRIVGVEQPIKVLVPLAS